MTGPTITPGQIISLCGNRIISRIVCLLLFSLFIAAGTAYAVGSEAAEAAEAAEAPPEVAGDEAEDGLPQPLWRFAVAGRVRSRPIIDGAGVAFIAEDRRVYRLSYQGDLLWKTRLPGQITGAFSRGSDGTLYAGLRDGGLCAVNPYGDLLWTVATPGPLLADPAVTYRGRIITHQPQGVLVYSHLGRLLWQWRDYPSGGTAPVADQQGRIYLGRQDGRVICLNRGGTLRWIKELSGGITALVPDRQRIYAAMDDGRFLALSREGELLWSLILPSPPGYPVYDRNGIYLIARSGTFFALDRDGNITESREGPFQGSPLLGETHSYLETKSGTVVSLEPSALTPGLPVTGSEKGPPLIGGGLLLKGGEEWTLAAYPAEKERRGAWSQYGGSSHHSGFLEPRGFPFSEDPGFGGNDFLYLWNLIRSRDWSSKEIALKEIEKGLIEGRPEQQEYLVYLLHYAVSEALLRPIYQGRTILNDFPPIRERAALLLGQYGDLFSVRLLTECLQREWDRSSAAAEIAALGQLRSDPDGALFPVLARRLEEWERRGYDNTLASAVLYTIQQSRLYHGELNREAARILLRLYHGNYSRRVREKSLDIFQRTGEY